jgi:hypothetical protein
MSAACRSIPLTTPGRLAGAVVAAVAVDAALAWRLGANPALPAYLAFGAAAGVVSVSDLVARRVPNRVTAPLYGAGITLLPVASAASGQWWPLARAGIAMAALDSFYLLLGLAFAGGMGMGDVKWAGAVGLFCGWSPGKRWRPRPSWLSPRRRCSSSPATLSVAAATGWCRWRRSWPPARSAPSSSPDSDRAGGQRSASPTRSANTRFPTSRAARLLAEGWATPTCTPTPASWPSSARRSAWSVASWA